MKNRFFALILCAVFAFSLIPSGVFAANEGNYGDWAYIVSAKQIYNSATDASYAELTVIDKDGVKNLTTVENITDFNSVEQLTGNISQKLDGTNGAPNWGGGFVTYTTNGAGVVTMLELVPYPTHGYSWIDGFYLVTVTGERNGILSFYDINDASDIDLINNPPVLLSCEYHDDGYSIIGIDEDDFAGDYLTTISEREQIIEKGSANAVIQVHEGQIKTVFSFTNGYSKTGVEASPELPEDVNLPQAPDFSFGFVTQYNESSGYIRVSGIGDIGLLNLSDVTLKGEVAFDTPVVCYKEDSKIVIEAVDVITGAVDLMKSENSVVIGDKEYTAWDGCTFDGTHAPTLFEYYQYENVAKDPGTKYYVYKNLILEIEPDESVLPVNSYAVILRSWFDEEMGDAYVTLGFTDNTQGTYRVGKLCTKNAAKPNDYVNDLATDFANNAMFGLVVNYKILDNGTLDLSGQYFKEQTAYKRTLKVLDYGRMDDIRVVNKGALEVWSWDSTVNGRSLYAYDEDSVIFALYGNPSYVVDGTDVKIDAGSATYYCGDGSCPNRKMPISSGCQNYAHAVGFTPVKAKAYKLGELEGLYANSIPSLKTIGGLNGSNVIGSVVVNSATATNKYVVAAAVTVGCDISLAQAAYKEPKNGYAYVVSAKQIYNFATNASYAELTVIDSDGVHDLVTVENVTNFNSVELFAVNKPQILDGTKGAPNWVGGLVKYKTNDAGIVTMLDVTPRASVASSFNKNVDGFYLVTVVGERNGILSFYDATEVTSNLTTDTSVILQSREYHDDGYKIISIGNNTYEGNTLATISPNEEVLVANTGNAILHISEGQIKSVFSFNNGTYSKDKGLIPVYRRITYDGNGTVFEIESETQTIGEDFKLTETMPTREGYKFKGWAESKAATEATYQPGDVYSSDSDIALYAVWEINKYNLVYKVDGEEYKRVEFEYGAEISEEAAPSKDGYTFSGWSEIPKTMPAEDVEVNGYFEANEVVSVSGIILDKSALEMEAGEIASLSATVEPSDAANKTVTWKSSDTSVITVSNGTVYAIGAGSATITATTVDGGYKATCSVTVTEGEQPIIYVSEAKARVGNTVSVDIALKNNPGFVSAKLKVNFNSDALSLTEVADAGVLGSTSHNPSLTSPYILYWNNGTVTENFVVNGSVATLTFTVSEDAELGEYPITVTYDEDDILDVDLESIEFITLPGKISVVSFTPGDLNDDGKVNVKDNVILSRHIASWEGYSESEIVYEAADLNNDGKVNVKDDVILARYIASWDGYESLPYLNN